MKEALYNLDNDVVAEQMTAMLSDPDIPTYDMFEDLVISYERENDDFKRGMDKALEILIWKNLPELFQYMKSFVRKEECA